MARLTLAYYCSGHGYGHATRVSAFASVLLSQSPRPSVYIISSAPKHVFSECIVAGALYRHAEIDPVIVQPLAYRVDRLKSVQALESFLEQKDEKVQQEVRWLKHVQADCVLSDAAFLGCLSAKVANIPSALITNFTFDSVFSFLSTLYVDETSGLLHPDISNILPHRAVLPVDVPIARERLSALVDQLHGGFRCADLLCLLPGSIPIPSFTIDLQLPSPDWVNLDTNSFHPEIVAHLSHDPSDYAIHPSIPFTSSSGVQPPKRSIMPFPLLVRPSNHSVYELEGRSHFLSSLGIPVGKHNPENTRLLVVSFGGQVFHTPRSRNSSQPATPGQILQHTSTSTIGRLDTLPAGALHDQTLLQARHTDHSHSRTHLDLVAVNTALELSLPANSESPTQIQPKDHFASPRISTDLHIWIPGAPPAAKTETPILSSVPTFATIPPTPRASAILGNQPQPWAVTPRLLPDESWIAVICGASTEAGEEEDLPDGFYIAPKDVYMPDLTATADVLLGKLGYGSVSECLETSTPFVYVPRPLFIEEHGLRLLLERDGVGVELSRSSYEAGDWGDAIQSAWDRGRDAKSRRRRSYNSDMAASGAGTRRHQVELMAQKILDWVINWKQQANNNNNNNNSPS